MCQDRNSIDILIVAEVPPHVEMVQRELLRAGILGEVRTVDNVQDLAPQVASLIPDIVIAVETVSASFSLQVLEHVTAFDPAIPVVVLIDGGDSGAAARCLTAGAASSFSTQEIGRLGPTIVSTLVTRKLELQSERAERAIQFTRLAVENATDAAFWIGPDGHLLYANQTACRWLGSTRDELITKTVSDIVPELSPDDWMSHWGQANRRRPAVFETELKTQRGGLLPIEVTAIRQKTQDLDYLVAFARNLSERKSAERALRESEHRYRELFERNLAGFYRTTLDGRFLECNQAMASIIGCASPGEVLELNAQDVYLDVSARSAFLSALRATGELRNYEVELQRKDGSGCWCLINSKLFMSETGESETIEGTLIDITERKHLEQELRTAQKMETIGILAGGIAHEYNNLLQAISGQAHRLRWATETGRTSSPIIDELEEAVRWGGQLTQQLLVISQRDTVTPRVLDLNSVVESSLGWLEKEIGDDLELCLELTAEALPVMVDRHRIEQVLANLVLNARDAMPRGGRIVIRSLRADEAWVCLEVEDSGVGIAEEERDRIFEPFFTSTESQPGKGIGLTVVHGIVARCGGRIEVASEVGSGSRFRVVLPAEMAVILKNHRNDGFSTGEAAGRAHIGLVLVVEDNPQVRAGVRDMLTAAGHTVAEAASVSAARESLSTLDVGLLVTDMVLPDGRGSELIELARSRIPALPTVIMTGYSPESLDLIGSDCPILLKPFSFAELSAAVDQAFTKIGGSLPTDPD